MPLKNMITSTTTLARFHSTWLMPPNTALNEPSVGRFDLASPRDQGRRRSPFFSSTKMKRRNTTPATADATMAVIRMPNTSSKKPDTVAVSAQPAAFPKLMDALSRPCSLSGVRSIDMPSTATSWVAAKILMRSPTIMSRPSCSTGSLIDMSASRASVRPSCAPSTQGLRRPMGRNM